MSLALSPMSSTPSSGVISSGEKSRKGRPPRIGQKQQLASLGEWMNSSAGLAFTPHILHIGVKKGRFEILCLSDSYLLAQSRGRCSRTRGINISVCSPHGHIIGGAIQAGSLQQAQCKSTFSYFTLSLL
ncbi:AT-hook motif nuclear-localized protein 5 [Forsythia ovata]|uniref:AT-hook motif nuclear-localized protein n=1 Tax=Forsythia ovata TaxID=205694 RepID=A0ABD1QGX8_9LAMI